MLKFLSGLIVNISDNAVKELVQERFWNAIISNNEEVIRIAGDPTTSLLMHLLAQTITSTNEELDAPAYIIDYVDSQILQDLEKWSEDLIKSLYISPKILNAFESTNPRVKLQAIKILPLLNIYRENIAAKLIFEATHNNDPEIIELSIRGLEYLINIDGVYEALEHFAQDSYSARSLIAIEILGNIADERSINILVKNFKNQNPWIIIASLDALQYFTETSGKKKEDLIDDLMNMLNYRGINEDLITDKCLETLDSLGKSLPQILDDFF